MKSLNRTFSRPGRSDRTEDLALDANARWGRLPTKELDGTLRPTIPWLRGIKSAIDSPYPECPSSSVHFSHLHAHLASEPGPTAVLRGRTSTAPGPLHQARPTPGPRPVRTAPPLLPDDRWFLFVNGRWPNPRAQDKRGAVAISPSIV